MAVLVLETAVSLRSTRTSVPTVDAYVGRPIADVESTAAVTVGRAVLPETHRVGEAFPWIPAAHT